MHLTRRNVVSEDYRVGRKFRTNLAMTEVLRKESLGLSLGKGDEIHEGVEKRIIMRTS